MSGEGEVTEDASKFFMSEKEGNTAALSGEVIMESVGSHEEEFNLNTPVTEPCIVNFSSSYPPFFLQV